MYSILYIDTVYNLYTRNNNYIEKYQFVSLSDTLPIPTLCEIWFTEGAKSADCRTGLGIYE